MNLAKKASEVVVGLVGTWAVVAAVAVGVAVIRAERWSRRLA